MLASGNETTTQRKQETKHGRPGWNLKFAIAEFLAAHANFWLNARCS
jgi:hypothetical protein